MKDWIKIVIVGIVCLLLGYFMGREHVRYELRQALLGVSAEMGKAFVPPSTPTSAAAVENQPQVSAPAPKVAPPPAPKKIEPISALLMSKSFLPQNLDEQRYRPQIQIDLQFSNQSSKGVRAFDGVLEFTDLLGNHVLSSRVRINEPIDAQGVFAWSGSIDFNQFMDDHNRLAGEPAENLKLFFDVGKVLFQDGTVQEF